MLSNVQLYFPNTLYDLFEDNIQYLILIADYQAESNVEATVGKQAEARYKLSLFCFYIFCWMNELFWILSS